MYACDSGTRETLSAGSAAVWQNAICGRYLGGRTDGAIVIRLDAEGIGALWP